MTTTKQAPSAEAMRAAREIAKAQQVYDRASFPLPQYQIAEIIQTAIDEGAREMREALENAYVLIEGLRIGTDWEIAPTIKTAMAEWSIRAEAALRKERER